ncbi:carbohydrate binding domain-containing protein [Shewanella pneumatophori]|uniref:CBM11 domain-containing protein n=1 Tax=Shewanella pneumatophori TaxID=314092 RepID=A0A9X1Z7P8_9GAMM|nr:carbohydrate binding domain-containing protein [Shewanella pneumatophori]MCL1136994.1 hypothetical protein [Shewanella pneumatophori]
MTPLVKLALVGLTATSLLNTPTSLATEQTPALVPSQWSYATDPYGSTATFRNQMITADGVWVNFKRIPRVDPKRNSWVEVIYSPEANSLADTKKISLTYKCDIPLLIKLSQSHYGKDGDKTYAHYQTKLPASSDWNTVEVNFDDFSRPDWTPKSSVDHGIVLNEITALYLTPSMTDKHGGEATLQVHAIELIR